MKQHLVYACLATLFLSACGAQESNQPVATNTGTATSTPAPTDAIQIEDYTFRISHSVEGEKGHIDLYLTKGSANEHVSGANIELTLTAPDGHTETINMSEDAPNKHYAATATMDHTGEYQLAARTSVGSKKFTPRFTITNTK